MKRAEGFWDAGNYGKNNWKSALQFSEALKIQFKNNNTWFKEVDHQVFQFVSSKHKTIVWSVLNSELSNIETCGSRTTKLAEQRERVQWLLAIPGP